MYDPTSELRRRRSERVHSVGREPWYLSLSGTFSTLNLKVVRSVNLHLIMSGLAGATAQPLYTIFQTTQHQTRRLKDHQKEP